MTHLRILTLALVGAMLMAACSLEEDASPPLEAQADDQFVYAEEMAAEPDMERARAEAPGGVDVDDDASAPDVDSDDVETPQRLLIYTAEIVLAIFDVTRTQEEAIDIVEATGGYVSHRSTKHLVLRVPAEQFRPILDELAELGDVLDLSWQAEDVTEKVRDVEIRLRNARDLRERLADLLERADTVEDALKIEAELERITLEIERLKGRLESFEDRIAYSTIEMHFDPKRIDEMPDDEFILPVAWVQTLGIESLLEAPERLR